ncbi:alpha/beta hydrolase fold domain-containing protein [Nonomuraea sp. NPDC050783]|uniref:alpha/beta hydrolase fold domain-containing protein n=1 Tax=Nonomuraea sp. NPDC050783 TaxID=3154634 RepID=UPI0034662682
METFRLPNGLSADVFRPVSAGWGCAVLVLHGGGWRHGAKEGVHTRCAALTSAGLTAVAVQYRLLGSAHWPAPLDDVAVALKWVRGAADELGVSPDRVVVQGHSAGGHLALLAGTLPDEVRPAAIVAYYPTTGFYAARAPEGPRFAEAAEFDSEGRAPAWTLFDVPVPAAELRAASPIDLVSPQSPPTLLIHGTADTVIPWRVSSAFHERLLDLGVLTDLLLVGGRDHEFDRAPFMRSTLAHATEAFVRRAVVDRQAIEAESSRYPFPPRDGEEETDPSSHARPKATSRVGLN